MKFVTPFRVGLLVLTSVVLLIVFMTMVKKGGLSDDDSVSVYAYFKDASGLGKKSRINIAGIPVGEITDIELKGTRALVTMRIRKDVEPREDAGLTKRSESLLGDYLLDLYPGSEASPLLKDGGEIKKVIDTQGMEAIFGSLEKITGDIQAVTNSLRQVLGSEKGQGSLEAIVQNLVTLSETMDRTIRQSADRLGAILQNVEGASATVRGITEDQQESIRSVIGNIELITRDVRDVLATVKKIVGSGEDDLKESVASLKETINRLDRSLANVEEVTENVKNGEGVAGTLLTDNRTAQKLNETIEDVSSFASRLTQLKVEVGMKSEYLFAQGEAKNFLTVRIMPKPDKYYLIEVVDDPRGTITTEYVQQNPPSVGEPVTQIQKVTTEGIKFSAQFAKRYSFTTLRFGIIESTGGVGTDFHFFNDHLSLRLDAFNFSVQELRYPRLRAAMRLQAFDHLFATAGVDDIMNNPVRDAVSDRRLLVGRDFFVGAGLFFTDEDLQALITVTGIPTP